MQEKKREIRNELKMKIAIFIEFFTVLFVGDVNGDLVTYTLQDVIGFFSSSIYQ